MNGDPDDVTEAKGVEAVRARASTADEAVADALRRGDEEVFTHLVHQYHGILRRIARLYVSSSSMVDDVVQDTWLAVIRGVWAFEGRSTLKTWILRILINRAKTRALRERRTVSLEEAEAAALASRDDGSIPEESEGEGLPENDPGADLTARTASSPEAGLLSQEVRARLRGVIDALPPRQRIVITMRDLEGCSSEEVCNVLGLSETNQRVLLHRARSSVRATMKPYLERG